MKQSGATVSAFSDQQLERPTDNKIKHKAKRTQRPNGKRADQFKRLIEACKRKELDTIRRLLANQAELVNLHDKQHRNLLHFVAILVADDGTRGAGHAQADSLDCFNYIASRCEPRLWFQVDQDGLTVLHLAVISGNNALVDEILSNRKRGHDIESSSLVLALDKERHSALHWAVITNNLECVRLLIGHSGVQLVHQADLNGATPLHYATQISDYPKYRRQLRRMLKAATGTSSEDRGNSPSSPRSSASGSNSCGDESDEPTSRLGDTPSSSSKPESHPSNLDILDLLVHLPGLNLECRDRDSRTPLLWAASSGNRQAVSLLLQAGANYLSQDTNNLGPLHCAASHGFTNCVECLLAPLASSSRSQLINQADHLNCTPLFYAVLSGNLDCVELLLERGALKDWQDIKGRTAAHFAALRGQLSTLKLLESHGANLWLANKQGDLPLHYAVKSGRQQVVAWLLERSPYERPVNAINNTGRAPIHLAVLKNNSSMADFLIRRGANLNQLVKIRDKSGERKQSAASGAQLALVNAGPQHQAGPSAFHYETALDMATRLSQRHLVELLEQNSAKSAAAVLATRQAATDAGPIAATRTNVCSLFDLQAAGVASPIGFETGGSSTEPPCPDQRAPQTGRVAWMPSLPRAMAEPIPQSSGDSANSSALSHSSLTSLNRGPARRDQEAEAGPDEQRAGQERASGRRPFKGGINYNNDRISASIKCKLYEDNSANRHSFPPLSSGSREQQARHLHKSAGSLPERFGGHQQEIVTNVSVYTSSPCGQCLPAPHSGKQKCPSCRRCDEMNESRRSAPTRTEAKAPARPLMRGLADGTISETSDTTELTSETGNYDESEREDELKLETSVTDDCRLPPLSSLDGPKRGASLMDVRQVSHAPALRTYNQQLPVIMSAEEDRSTSGEMGQSQLLSTGANEEPRFDRSQRGRGRVRRSDRIREQVRSPVADYIHSTELSHSRQRSVSEARPNRAKQQEFAPSDYSQVRAKVDSHRNDSGLSSHFSDQLDGTPSFGAGSGRRSKSWSSSVAAQPDGEPPGGGGRCSRGRQAQAMMNDGIGRDDGDRSRSCSRQTIIKTRRLSVDSDELATTIEKSIRRYRQESKIFEQLQSLKRSQIRSGRANECLLVKRLVEHFRQELLQGGVVGLEAYRGPYTYQAYELYLYDQLKRLSQSNTALLAGGRVPHKFTYQPPAEHYEQATAAGSESVNDRGAASLSQKEAHDFLEEDMKAEQELRRVLERGSMDSAGGHLSPACDETIAIEPSGALQEIRVRQDEQTQQVVQGQLGKNKPESEASNVDEIKSEIEAGDEHEPELQTDGLAEELARAKLERQARNSSNGSSRRSSVELEREKLETLPLWGASGQRDKTPAAAELDESERNQIEREASDLSAAILVDALGNVSRVGSPTGLRADSKQEEADVELADAPPSDDKADEEEALDQRASPPDRGRRRSVVNIGDKIEVIYHKVGIEIDTVAESEAPSEESAGEGEREQSGESAPDGEKDTDQGVGSRSSLAQTADVESPRQSSGGVTMRRASSPHGANTETKKLTGSRRSSSPVDQSTADAMVTRRVFNGFDLDSLREHRRRHQAAEDSFEKQPAAPVTGKPTKRTRLQRRPRSQLPAGPYRVYVPVELIRDRWDQVKRLERGRKLRTNPSERLHKGSRETEAESGGLGNAGGGEVAHARSQPNLALASEDEAGRGAAELAPDSCSNFILIYEVNNKLANRAVEPIQAADDDDDGGGGRQAGREPGGAEAKREQRIIWCQKRMTRIVDVRTLKRTLSVPDSLIYSNELLKRFNLLKL